MGPGIAIVDLHRHAVVLHVHVAQIGRERENHPVGQGGYGAALQQEQNHDGSEQQFVLSGEKKSSHRSASFAMRNSGESSLEGNSPTGCLLQAVTS
jgi:hypothetical protein